VSLGRRIAVSISWLALAQVASRVSSLVVVAILARLLTPSDFGLIALTSLVVGLISTFGDTGLTSALIQRVEVTIEHFTSAFWLNGVAALALAVAGTLAARPIAILYGQPRLTLLLIGSMTILPIRAIGQVPDAILQRRLAFRQIAVIESASTMIAGLVSVSAAVEGFGVWALVLQGVIIALVSSVAKFLVVDWRPTWYFSPSRIREMLLFSAGVLGCALVNYIARNVDYALIGAFLGVRALGYYSLAYNLMLMPSTYIGGVVLRVMFPALSTLQADIERFRSVYLRMLRLVSTAVLPVVIGLGAVANVFVHTVYGEQWSPSVEVLQILTVVGCIEAVNGIGVGFYSKGKAGLLLVLATVSAVTMTCSFAVGVHWGVIGVAWAYIAVTPVLYGVPQTVVNRLLGVSFLDYMNAIGPPLYAGMTMCGVLIVAPAFFPLLLHSSWTTLLELIALGVFSYAALLVSFATIFGRQRDGLVPWLTGRHLAERGPIATAPT
jgi:O-antigen/teichoic acid export membrane protein